MDTIRDYVNFIKIKQNGWELRLCMTLVILFSSFDIVLTIDIGGYTFRMAQIFLGIAILIYFLYCIVQKKIVVSKIIVPLFVWVGLQAILIKNSPNINNAVGYYLWLITDILIIVIMYSVIDSRDKLFSIYSVYLDSFYIMALVGIVQFILGVMGIDFYLYTWMGKLPRIRGFSFESSYYSTYLIIGWVILGYLLEKGTTICSKNRMIKMYVVVTTAMILSTSRMGYIFMAIWIFVRIVVNALFSNQNYNKKNWARIALVVLVIIAIVIFYLIFKTTIFDIYLQGLGIKGLSSHSANDRINGAKRLLNIFLMNPLKGYSVGGVDPIIAEMYGIKFGTGLGFCVWIELLVASGMIGFCILLFAIIYPLYKLIKNSRKTSLENEARAIAWAFLIEAGILSFNQNILRLYFWILFGMIFIFTKIRRLTNGE